MTLVFARESICLKSLHCDARLRVVSNFILYRRQFVFECQDIDKQLRYVALGMS